MKHQRFPTVWLVVAVQLCASLAYATELTLCVARDGHVALETPHELAACVRDYQRHHGGASGLDTPDAADHGCKDTPLVLTPTTSASSRPDALTPQAVVAKSSAVGPRSVNAPAPVLFAVSVPRQRTIHELRTVILLI